MNKIINLTPDFNKITDKLELQQVLDKFSGGPKKTKIIIRNADTGEVLGEFSNKVVISGSAFSAIKAYGLDPSIISIPDYNKELNLDEPGLVSKAGNPKDSCICLFACGDSGCGTTGDDVFVANYIDRIAPEDDIIPFRYVDSNNDLSADLREVYFGRKTISGDSTKVAYYFKKPETEPQLHLIYSDGTSISGENIYNSNTEQLAECYVELKLLTNRDDFRDYFEQVLGWDKARISTLSLCTAYYDEATDGYKWFKSILPYSKLNFPVEWLVDLTKAIEFDYCVYF